MTSDLQRRIQDMEPLVRDLEAGTHHVYLVVLGELNSPANPFIAGVVHERAKSLVEAWEALHQEFFRGGPREIEGGPQL